ncbi:MAG: hypothetical protein NXI31_21715 [bacterium]|nr:hypothetical protein [bacterium]
MHLSNKKLPRLLRLLIWLILIGAAIRFVRFGYGQFNGEPLRISQIAFPIVNVWAAIQLRRGLREGLDWLLMLNAAFCALIGYGLLFADVEPSGRVLGSLAWLVSTSAYLLWCRYRLPWRERGSYSHWMSDPDVREDAAAWFATRDRLVEQDRIDPPDPDELVSELLEDADLELMRHRLQAQPEHFGMAVFRALDRRDFHSDPEVLILLIRLLPESLHERAVERLLRCLPHVATDERGTVLEMLAATGRPEVAPLLAEELAGEQAEKVAKGLATAARADRLHDELYSGVEAALREAAGAGEDDGAAAVVLALRNPEIVRDLIASSHDLESHSPRALVAIAEAGVPLPDEEMLTLWRHVRDEGDWYWCWRLLEFVSVPEQDLRDLLAECPAFFGNGESFKELIDQPNQAPHYSRLAYGRALEQLQAREVGDIEDLLRSAIAMDRGRVSDTAARLLGKHLGAPQDWSFEDVADKSPGQRMLATLSLAHSYACNGGLSHAFDCLLEDEMSALEPALEVVAPAEVREIWLAAMRAISPDPLPADEGARRELIRSRYDEVEQRLDELSTAFYRLTWKLEIAMELYAIEHKDELAGH